MVWGCVQTTWTEFGVNFDPHPSDFLVTPSSFFVNVVSTRSLSIFQFLMKNRLELTDVCVIWGTFLISKDYFDFPLTTRPKLANVDVTNMVINTE